jgi:phosphoribosyl-ATP pyrophosphohydrolase/phosphoribosyl-AMP cyclohydrolase
MKLNFDKLNGLIPVVIQNYITNQVLMVGFMNEAAYQKTIDTKKVTFFSRSKQKLWTKGETSGNFLNVVEIYNDCDNDTLLIKVNPCGPTCHTGKTSCFNEESAQGFIYQLENIIKNKISQNEENSYTNKIFRKGINKIAQKVGEEAIETIIEAKDDNRELFLNESADLMYHFLILLKAKNVDFKEIENVLLKRNKN